MKNLTWRNVDTANRLLRFEQAKVSGHSSAGGVTIPLGDSLLGIIGEPPATAAGRDGTVFPLPSYKTCIMALAEWVRRAGIGKHITWHCARHSFAVNVLNNGANIKTVTELLGHSGLTHTEKYTRAVDSLKRAAVDSLPGLDFCPPIDY